MRSEKFEEVKRYYDTVDPRTNKRLWNKDRVFKAVGKWITKEEYEEITGESYLKPEVEE